MSLSAYYLKNVGLLLPSTIGISFVLTYLLTSFLCSNVFRSYLKEKRPPRAPYWIPVLGHALSFFWDTGFVGEVQKVFHPGVVGLQLFTTRINFVTGSDYITALWRSKDLDAKAVTSFSLKEFFLTPAESMKVYQGDNSGINPKPHPTSDTAEKNRYYYQNRKAIVGFFNGSGLKSMGNRFSDLLISRVKRLDLGHEWTKYQDLYEFIQGLLIGPAVEAMCGPVLLDQNKTFGDDFWKLDHDILYFFKAYPRWIAPRAYQNRDKILQSMKNWHAFARDNFDESCVEPDGHDRFYGSPIMRSRQEYLSNVDHLDADAIASQDLGLLWAENANSIPAVFWMIYEALQRESVLLQALAEVTSSQGWSSLNNNLKLKIEPLCDMPLLQSMYAETLRLYTSLFTLRSCSHGSLDLGNFTIPKDELIAVDSRASAMDSSIWNTGTTQPQPLARFWAERFIVSPEDPKSGPVRFNASKARESYPKCSPHHQPKNPYFTMDGLAGAWLPFGGGNRSCPGCSF